MAYKSNDGYAESSGDHPVDGIDLSERGVSCHRVGAQVIQRSLYDDIRDIFKVMLDNTSDKLSDYQDEIENSDMSVHELMTFASIVELESPSSEDRPTVAGVFFNRLADDISLGSDVTTYYALQFPMTSDLTTAQFATVNPYNTRAANMRGQMPIGPICNPSLSSLKASIEPTDSDYLYFVADKNGNIFYTNTLAEHEAMVQEIKDKGDWIW